MYTSYGQNFHEIKYGIDRVFHASCGYNIAAIVIGDRFYSGKSTAMRQNTSIEVKSIRQITCRVTTRVFAVTHAERILLLDKKKTFQDQTFHLELNETIVSIVPGFNFEVVVIGKKKFSRLHPSCKFDDVDIRTK